MLVCLGGYSKKGVYIIIIIIHFFLIPVNLLVTWLILLYFSWFGRLLRVGLGQIMKVRLAEDQMKREIYFCGFLSMSWNDENYYPIFLGGADDANLHRIWHIFTKFRASRWLCSKFMAILGWSVARRIKFFLSKSLKTDYAIKSRYLLCFY